MQSWSGDAAQFKFSPLKTQIQYSNDMIYLYFHFTIKSKFCTYNSYISEALYCMCPCCFTLNSLLHSLTHTHTHIQTQAYPVFYFIKNM